MARETVVHWKLGYTDLGVRESESSDKFMGENRLLEIHEALSKRTIPESLQLSKDSKRENWSLGSKCVAPRPGQSTENRERFGPKPPIEKTEGFAHLGVELRKANIDMAFGHPKSASHWAGTASEELSRHAGAKFGCSKPEGLGHLKAELRKSSLVLHTMPAAFRNTPVPTSEIRRRYTDKGIVATPGFAESVGKDFRASHIDIAQGAEKHTRDWIQVSREAAQDHAEDKWQCKKPEGLVHLIAELRKSNVPLSGAGETFMVRKPIGPQRGHRPGLAASYSSPQVRH